MMENTAKEYQIKEKKVIEKQEKEKQIENTQIEKTQKEKIQIEKTQIEKTQIEKTQIEKTQKEKIQIEKTQIEEKQIDAEQRKYYEKFMRQAIRQAKKALALNEVPIGCVIVKDGKIIARGYNRRNTDKSTLSHAELSAIKKACKKTGDWRLEGCTMFVTLEPCQMCAGALVQSRIDEVVIACMNPKAGCAGSVMNLLQVEHFNHQVAVKRGILQEECSAMLSDFFKSLRQRKKELKQNTY